MKLLNKNIKCFILVFVLIIIASSISVYATAQYYATQVEYKDNISVANALDDLYNKIKDINETDATENDILNGKKAYTKEGLIIGTNAQIEINPQRLHQINGTTKISAIIGNKYIIGITVGSYTSQNYKPSITSGCTIIKETDLISASYGGWINYSKSYLVTATSNEIVITGNSADYTWNHITYYEI